ncbi:MAG: hypothetical protein JWM57_957 [Phycisphaerales bacterium]|nr:hypothetical protein [Phycisphaerales bacterium]
MLDEIHFLGTVQQATHHANAASFDLIGLSPIFPSTIFPLNLSSTRIVVSGTEAAFSALVGAKLIASLHETPSVVAESNFGHAEPTEVAAAGGSSPRSQFVTLTTLKNAEGLKTRNVLVLPLPPMTIEQPCVVTLRLEKEGESNLLGHFAYAFVKSMPLTEAELQARRSRVGAMKELGVAIKCLACGMTSQLVSLANPAEQPPDLSPTRQWLYSLADQWQCACGKTTMTTKYLKEGLPAYFRDDGSINHTGTLLNGVPLYQNRAINALASDYHTLINSSPSEEIVQVFLENHPLFWSFLSPVQIIHKPSILTRYKADFAILSASKSLIFIEIEKPTTRLTKANGGLSADVQAGFDQVRDWRTVIADHRLAVINELGLTPDQVHQIRFIVIAGLAHKISPNQLHKFRQNIYAEAEFFTFDDLEAFIHRLSGALGAL